MGDRLKEQMKIAMFLQRIFVVLMACVYLHLSWKPQNKGYEKDISYVVCYTANADESEELDGCSD